MTVPLLRKTPLTRVYWVSTFLLLISCLPAKAQQDAVSQEAADNLTQETSSDSAQVFSSERRLQWYSMFTNVPHDWVRYSRLTFRVSNVSAFVGMTVLTAALIATDDESWKLSDRFYRSSKVTKSASDFFEYLGDGRPQFGLSAGFAIYGLAFGDQRALRTASQSVEAILACGIVVQVLKHTTGRQSPFASTKPGGVWDFLPNQIDYHKHVPRYDAFPSGHIATALATVTVVAENYPEWTWVRPAGYTIVALIGISMANTGIHWYSDYPLGLALGYSFGMLASHPDGGQESASESDKGVRFSVVPVISGTGAGLGLFMSL